jgi:hypothetical protein
MKTPKGLASAVIGVSMAQGSAVEQHCAFIIAQCKRRGEPIPEYVTKSLAAEEKKKQALKELIESGQLKP